MRTAALLPLLLLLPSTALAEDAFDAALARGRQGSCAWLREALLLRPDRADVREELAACEEAQGDKAVAAAHWASLAQEARLRVFSFDHAGARLVVRVPPPALVPGLRVTVAGAEIPASLWGGAPVAQGTLPVRVTVPGHTLFEGTLHVGAEGAVLDVPRGRDAAPDGAPQPLTRPRSSGAVAGGAVAVTLGGLGLVAGISLVMIQTADASQEDGIHVAGGAALLTAGGLFGAGIPLLAWGGRRVPVGGVASVAPLVTPLLTPVGASRAAPAGAVLSVAGVLR